MKRRRVTAVTLSWESLDFLPRLIDSTLEWADDFVLLDTGSTDGSREYLAERVAGDDRLHYFTVDTTAETFNRGRCLNLLCDYVRDHNLNPYWLAVIDCDEIFERRVIEHAMPQIQVLPRVYTQVSFRRPNLWYSETMVRNDGAHATFREAAFQRWNPRWRYPERVFHMKRTMHSWPITFESGAYLLHYELRNVERSRLQFERLATIDREWEALVRDPDDAPDLVEIVPLELRGEDLARPTLRRVARDVARSVTVTAEWKLRRRAHAVLKRLGRR